MFFVQIFSAKKNRRGVPLYGTPPVIYWEKLPPTFTKDVHFFLTKDVHFFLTKDVHFFLTKDGSVLTKPVVPNLKKGLRKKNFFRILQKNIFIVIFYKVWNVPRKDQPQNSMPMRWDD